jgi:hypothetical protein
LRLRLARKLGEAAEHEALAGELLPACRVLGSGPSFDRDDKQEALENHALTRTGYLG